MKHTNSFDPKQILFKEVFVGTLIYSVALGFFNDYTSIVIAKSFSTIFLASIVLELLTIAAFWVKKKIVSTFKNKPGAASKFLLIFGVWLVMFSSKFVFVAVVDFIFGENININGFFGILLVVVTVTVVHKFADKIFSVLGQAEPLHKQ